MEEILTIEEKANRECKKEILTAFLRLNDEDREEVLAKATAIKYGRPFDSTVSFRVIIHSNKKRELREKFTDMNFFQVDLAEYPV